jgi:predicted DNA-binding ArsR family transcriptional regulator
MRQCAVLQLLSQIHKMRGVENQFLKNIITQEPSTQSPNWITVEDPFYINLIFEALGNEDTKSILDTVSDTPRIISEIIQIANMPQTSGYRKINSLIDNGLLIVQGYVDTADGKKIKKYKSIFENVIINIEKNRIIVKILLSKESLEYRSLKAAQC